MLDSASESDARMTDCMACDETPLYNTGADLAIRDTRYVVNTTVACAVFIQYSLTAI